MNKLVKGAVATAAGVALLMGGAGTFALWNTSEEVNAGTVEAGTLTIDKGTAAGVWKDNSTGTPSAAIAIADWRIVPGDTLEFTQVVTINATGDNLEATLDVDEDSIKASTVAAIAAESADLKDLLVVSIKATGTGVSTDAAGVITVAPTLTGTSTVTVTVTVSLPSTVGDAVGEGSIAQKGSVSFADLALTLKQNSR